MSLITKSPSHATTNSNSSSHSINNTTTPTAQTLASTTNTSNPLALDSLACAKRNSAAADSALEKIKGSPEKFKLATSVVVARNQELKNLSGFIHTANFDTPKDNTYFWCGNSKDANNNPEYSAMLTAQSLAKSSGGRTIEMTHGGQQLHNYQGESSYQKINKRFQYLESAKPNEPHNLRGELMAKGAKAAGHDDVAPIAELGKHESSVAGTLWDVASANFSNQAEGIVRVIHAIPSSDPFFQSKQFETSTWIVKEEPALKAQGKTTVQRFFAEDLTGKLEKF